MCGPYVEYYENGLKRLDAFYKDNVFDSIYTFYTDDGKLSYEKHFKNGKADGVILLIGTKKV